MKVVWFKSEDKFDLWGCLEATMASESAAGPKDHGPLVEPSCKPQPISSHHQSPEKIARTPLERDWAAKLWGKWKGRRGGRGRACQEIIGRRRGREKDFADVGISLNPTLLRHKGRDQKSSLKYRFQSTVSFWGWMALLSSITFLFMRWHYLWRH